MTFDPSIPTNLPSPSVAVDAIRTNFSQYAQVFDNNHSALNTSTQGKHTHVVFQEQLTDPVVEGSFDSLYGKSVTSNLGVSQNAFVRIPQFLPDDRPNFPMQLTFNGVNTTGPVYQSFLPGGYLLFFGQATQVAQANPPVISIVVTLTPAPTEILCVIANSTRVQSSASFWGQPIAVKVLNNFQFQINPNNIVLVNQIIPWVAICKQ